MGSSPTGLVPYKKRKFRPGPISERRTQGEDVLILWGHREKMAIYKPRRAQETQALPTPWSQTARLHKWEKTTFYWLSLPPGGTLLWWLNQVHGWPNKHLWKTLQEWLEEPYGEFHCVNMVHNLTLFISPGLEKEMATRSSILAWRIQWTKEPGRLQSMGSQESDTTWRLNHHHHHHHFSRASLVK